jgi:plastocyanin
VTLGGAGGPRGARDPRDASGRGRRRRGTAAGLSLLFVFALLVASLAGSAGATNSACAWQRHAKRVVKHVKRHGKVTKVVRIKHYWTCDAVAATPEPTPAPVVPPPATPPAAPPVSTPPVAEPEANAVSVTADDHGGVKKYTLSNPTAHAGKITVQLNNIGEDPHNLNIQREENGVPVGPDLKIGKTEAGGHPTQQFELPAGTYRFYCTIQEHWMEGMETEFTVVE